MKKRKSCNKCKRVKFLNEFYKYDNTCKECRKKYRKKHYYENVDKEHAQSKKYYKENKDILKKYYEKNRDKKRKYFKKYYHEHKEYYKLYYRTEKYKIICTNKRHKRRACMKDTDISKYYLIMLKNNTKICKLCNKPIKEYHLDHIIPLNVGGKHVMDNVRYICSNCNVRRPHDGSDINKKKKNKII